MNVKSKKFNTIPVNVKLACYPGEDTYRLINAVQLHIAIQISMVILIFKECCCGVSILIFVRKTQSILPTFISRNSAYSYLQNK